MNGCNERVQRTLLMFLFPSLFLILSSPLLFYLHNSHTTRSSFQSIISVLLSSFLSLFHFLLLFHFILFIRFAFLSSSVPSFFFSSAKIFNIQHIPRSSTDAYVRVK